MIYLFSEHELITPEIEQELLKKLPPKRREKALRFTHHGGKISCILGYMLFLYGFRHIYNQPTLPDFAVKDNEKPYLANHPDIHFNISHCKDSVVCIFGKNEVGIDIQEVRPSTIKHLSKICSEEEINLINNSPTPEKEFCRIWSIKEAISKLSGDGIFRDIKNLSTDGIYTNTVFIEPDRYLSYATYDEDADFPITRISLKQLLEL